MKAAITALVPAHAGLDLLQSRSRRSSREIVHAVLDAPFRVYERASLGVVGRVAGEAVCGEPGELGEFGEPAAALWEPVITCPACVVLVRAGGVELMGCSL